MTRDIVADANRNLETSFLRLAANAPDGTTRTFGPLTAASAGLSAPLYNRIFVFETPPRDTLAGAVAWIRERDLPYWVTVAEPVVDTVEPLMDDLGLATATTQPGMAISTLEDIPSTESDVTISEITTPDGLDDFVPVAASVFGTPVDLAETVYQAALAADKVRPFLARVNGRPGACGLLVQTGDVAGVYTIAVLEALRRQGIGELMTWTVLRAGRDAGCQVGVLQSSEMAYSLYDRMGFETVVTYHHFGPTT